MNHVRSKAVAPVKQTVLGSLSECPAHCPGRVNDCVWSAWRSWTMPPKSGSHSRRGGQHGSGQGRASQSGGAGSGGARARSDPPPPPDLDYDYDYDYDDVGYDYYGDDPYGDDLDYGALMDFGGLLHSSLGSDAFVVVEAMREAMVARGRSREALGPSPPAPAHATTATGMNRRSAVRVSHAWSNGCRQTTEWCALVVRGRPEDRCQRVAGTSFVATCASTVILCVQCYYYVVPVRGAAVPRVRLPGHALDSRSFPVVNCRGGAGRPQTAVAKSKRARKRNAVATTVATAAAGTTAGVGAPLPATPAAPVATGSGAEVSLPPRAIAAGTTVATAPTAAPAATPSAKAGPAVTPATPSAKAGSVVATPAPPGNAGSATARAQQAAAAPGPKRC